ncbi:dynamin family domain-containing protein [Trichoderma breve]|uniref:Dynamin family domain-containing protein n=1 Tax=Trichoderma breve TaxID=2034170 RepID=A0A9W9E5D0_9HYPO|nr:dynamin family domain-containing protein [Trichoderma breve]KAJ4855291.1 dynamin family domain-containing protein [Trichoderma breve]
MVLTQLASTNLEGLCSKEQLELLNTIDSLRSQGVSHYISLPQIIVCGDQSSGKSSVLEAISGVSFPVSTGLCTRFPTELILRTASHTSVKVSIIPHLLHKRDKKDASSDFHEQLDSVQQLPDLIENAKAYMGIKTLGKAFSNDVLRIEISGPDRPHLTIVDLPGLIHSETKNQSASDVHLITQIVKSFMSKQRSIILAVISAKNDYANQIVLKLARDTDPRGLRTLGIITKPDTLAADSTSEKSYISLAKNLDVVFRLGWHVLRNRDTDADKWTLAQRDVQEKEFFSKSAWSALPESSLGIVSLRSRLSKLLLHQIASELPSLMDEISQEIEGCETELGKFGQPRITAQEQRIYMIQISQSFQSLMQAAVDGTYTDPFFSDSETKSGYDKRIRALIQNLSRDFAKEMEDKGRFYKTVDSHKKVVDMMAHRRGRELPNSFSPAVVTDLFREQSKPWQAIVNRHVNKVWEAARVFVDHLISHISDSETSDAIMDAVVRPKMKAILANLLDKTTILLQLYRDDHPITYSDFGEALQKIRMKRYSSQMDEVLQRHFSSVSLDSTSSHVSAYINFVSLKQELAQCNEPDLYRWSAAEALDSAEAYYEIAFRRLIDEISIQVIETGLVAEIREILSPLAVAYMDEDEMEAIVGEKESIREERRKLEAKLKLLHAGSETCKKFSGFRALVFNDSNEDANTSATIAAKPWKGFWSVETTPEESEE